MSELPARLTFSKFLLCSTASNFRLEGVKILQLHIAYLSANLAHIDISAYFDRLADYGRVQALKQEANARLIGIGVLASLTGADDQHSVERRIGVLNFLRDALEVDRSNHFNQSCVQVVASLLGNISSVVNLKPELQLVKERYLITSLDWLGDVRYEVRRYAAALVLSELITNVPTLIIDVRGSVQDRLWGAILDQSPLVREVVACTIGSFLHLIYSRIDTLDASTYFRQAIAVISDGLLLKNASYHKLHGALLLLAAVLKRHPRDTKSSSLEISPGKYWRPPVLCRGVLEAWLRAVLGTRGIHAKDKQIHLVAMGLLPSLACFMIPSRVQMHDMIKTILMTVDAGSSSGFAAISRCRFILVAILDTDTPLVAPLLKEIIDAASNSLVSITRDLAHDVSIIRCFTVLIESLGEYYHRENYILSEINGSNNEIHLKTAGLLPSFLCHSLTRTMFYLIRAVHEHFPSLRSNIRRYVHDQIMSILRYCKLPRVIELGDSVRKTGSAFIDDSQRAISSYKNLNAPKQRGIELKLPSGFQDVALSPRMPCIIYSVWSKIRFVLGILLNFSFFEDQQTRCTCSLLMETSLFIMAHVVDLEPSMRLEAVIASWKCMGRAIYINHSCKTGLNCNVPLAFIQAMVERVIIMAITGNPALRLIILNTFPPFCDVILLLVPKLLRIILMLALDETLLVQQIALQFASRLMDRLPTLVLPKINAYLTRLLSKLEPSYLWGSRCSTLNVYLPNSKTENWLEALQLLRSVLDRGCHLLAPCVPSILPLVIHTFARSEVSGVLAPVAAGVIGQLATLCSKTAVSIVKKVIPKVVSVLCAQSNHRPHLRYITARALEHLISTTGDTLTPYCFRAQGLIDMLLEMLETQTANQDIQALRTLGAIGALDPSFLSLFQLVGQETWPSKLKDTVELAIASELNLQGVDKPRASVFFRNNLKKNIKLADNMYRSQSEPTRPGVPIEELIQVSALDMLLDIVANFPQLRKEALCATDQVCGWLAPDSLPLCKMLRQLLCILASHNDSNDNETYLIPSPSSSNPEHLMPQTCIRDSQQNHPLLTSFCHPRKKINFLRNRIDNFSIQVLVSNLVHVLELVASSTMVAECISGRFAAALEPLWSHATNFWPLTRENDDLHIEHGGLINLLSCLHTRLPPHIFVVQLRWVLPPLLNCLSRNDLHPCLHIVDLIADSLIMSGLVNNIIYAILSRLRALSCLGMSNAQNDSAKTFATGVDACLLLVSAIRLVNRIQCKSLLRELASPVINSMLSCLNGLNEFVSDMDTPITSINIRNFNIKKGNGQHAVMVPELVFHGLTVMARKLHIFFVPHVQYVQFAIKDWLDTGSITDVANTPAFGEPLFSSSDSCNYMAPVTHATILAYIEYNHVVSAIIRGMSPPAPSQHSTILVGNYHELLHYLTSSKPLGLANTHFFLGKRLKLLASRCQPRHCSFKLARTKLDFIIDLTALQRAWDTNGLVTNGDWTEWMHRISVELLRQSPSPYLRPCSIIAEVHQPFAYQLFKPAFLAVWVGCGLTTADCFGGPRSMAVQLATELSTAICSCSLPSRFLELLLELTDFMRIYCAPLPIDLSVLAQHAFQARAYGNALALRESCLRLNPSTNLFTDTMIDALVIANNHFGLVEAATGTLAHSPGRTRPQLYEQLGHWDASLSIYETGAPSNYAPSLALESSCRRGMDSESGSKYVINTWLDAEVGRLRCHLALFDHQTVSACSRYLWGLLTSNLNMFPDLIVISTQPQINPTIACTAVAHVIRQRHQESLLDVAALGARSSLMLQNWADMEMYVSYWDAYGTRTLNGVKEVREKDASNGTAKFDFSNRTHELFLFQAVMLVHLSNFTNSSKKIMNRAKSSLSQACTLIQAARAQLVNNTRVNIRKGYGRVYYDVTSAQQLTEFEEILRLKSQVLLNSPVYQSHVHTSNTLLNLLAKWKRRMRWWGGEDAGVWLNTSLVHKLLLCPTDDVERYIRLAMLCHNSGQLSRCGNILAFIDAENIHTPNACVSLQVCHLLWTIGNHTEAYFMISRITEHLISDYQTNNVSSEEDLGDEILITSLMTRSEWCGILTRAPEKIVRCWKLKEVIILLKQVTKLVPLQPRAWHSWALANYELCEQIERRHLNALASSKILQLTKSNLEHAVHSIEGFFWSLKLFDADSTAARDATVLQDTLRLLTIWFKYGAYPQVNTKVQEGLSIAPIHVWLGVLPQLIARVNHPVEHVCHLVANLLVQVGRAHPQALIYPITVSAKAISGSRRTASACILDGLQQCEYCGDPNTQINLTDTETEALVAEANLVSRELHHSAITWHEAWYQGIEVAANLFFGDADIKATFASLIEIHSRWNANLDTVADAYSLQDFPGSVDCFDSSTATIRLAAFMHVYGSELLAAESYLYRYHISRRNVDLGQAWDIYSEVHRKVKQSVFTDDSCHLDLGHVAPALVLARSMRLAIPGTNISKRGRFNNLIVRIMSFSPNVQILSSKQRPRCLRIHGSDGGEYDFLLKGHEDLRQDERVMQLFGLINALLAKNTGTGGVVVEPLHVQRYVVMPLSNNSGLIGWVHHCSTIHRLIINHRSYFSISLDVESCFARSIAREYNKLLLVQKLDTFKYILNRTYSNDLAKMLCITSGDIAIWLKRRTNFTRSLAVTSVVGYVLGLGDRHLSNIMVSDQSGEIIHIDFGDCFEVALNREQFPERIPFRLTKLLVHAMEVSGVEGSYRLTCNYVMKVLRSDYHSLMAMLEAFVHDPLVGWKLLTTLNNKQHCTLLKQAMLISDCVQKKLTGRLLHKYVSATQQVGTLIHQAQSPENLCQMFGGWCPFW